MTAPNLRLNALDDLLAAERSFRALSESRLRGLIEVLTELAYRMDGEKLEAARKNDPTAPRSWTAETWSAFFAGQRRENPTWSGADDGLRQVLLALSAERDELRRRVFELDQQLARPRLAAMTAETPTGDVRPAERRKVPPHPVAFDPLVSAAYAGLPKELAEFQPPPVPAEFQERFRLGASVTPKDAQANLRRRWMTLRILASSGIAPAVEYYSLIGRLDGISQRAGSVMRPIEALAEQAHLIEWQTPAIPLVGSTLTRLTLIRLSADGRQLCSQVGWQPVESEWERLIRLHQGDQQEHHTLAVLIFAAHARLRGWQVTVLPEIAGTSARPDVRVEREGEVLFVEVETGTRQHAGNGKWNNLAQLNQGRIALCARNVAERGTLVEDCRRLGSGLATDLETLIAVKMHQVEPKDSLWAVTW